MTGIDDKDGREKHKLENEKEEAEKTYPSTKVVVPAMMAIYLSVFLVALDRTIIGTAIPTISKQFNSFGDIAWYEAGFLLPLCMLQLSFGRVYKYYSAKWIMVTLVAIFEIGSIVCASAPNSNALIVGRVIAGIGAAGINAGAFLLISLLVPLQARPKWSGGLGGVFGISSVLGPVLGGYLTSVTWRWCFWINVPVGGLSLALLVFLAPNRPPPVEPDRNWRGKLMQLDPVGFILVAPAIICLLFAIEFGGSEYPWNDGRVIALFVIAGVFGVAFVVSQVWRKEEATIPIRILKQRSILSGCIANFGIGPALVLFALYLPIWFQVIQGKSPSDSGLSVIALLLSSVVAVVGGGIATSVFGYYTPLLIVGSAILIAGSALISTWTVNIEPGIWIGYQIVTGFGLGLVLQQPIIAAQTVLSDSDAPIGLSVLTFLTFLGGTVFITVAQTILESSLVDGLRNIIPDLDASSLTNAGAASLREDVSEDQLPKVLAIYNDSMKSIWYLALGLSCVVLAASLGMEWKSVKKAGKKNKKEQAAVLNQDMVGSPSVV